MATRSHSPTSPPTYDGLGPAAYVIPVPLIVLAVCDPRQLMVWVALRWLAEVFPEVERQGGPSDHLLSRLCMIDRRSLPAILAHLRDQQLVQDLGLRRVARAARPHYVIDADHVDALTRRHFTAILARWQLAGHRLPRQVPPEQLALFTSMTGASGISLTQATGASGITPINVTGASGITPINATGASGITRREEHFAVSVTGDAPYRTIFVPLVVFERCDPSELATWMAQCWLLTVQADAPAAIRAAQVAQIGRIGRGKLRAYYERLLAKHLLIHVGIGHAACTYVISHHLRDWRIRDQRCRCQPCA